MDKDIIAEAKDAFKACEEADGDNRTRFLDDLRFARLGEQWDEKVKTRREKEGRPCLTLNRMPSFIRQVTNDARQNKPSIKVSPVDNNADVKTAQIINGLIRNIEYTSGADAAYDTAVDFAASGNIGYWRIDLDYACYDTFDLDIKIRRIANPLTVYGDPRSIEADSSDWNVAFITDMMKKEEYLAAYPQAKQADWQGGNKDDASWFEKDGIRVAEYWKRVEVEKNLLLLSDGRAILEDDFLKVNEETGYSQRDMAMAQGLQVIQQRATKVYDVRQWLLSGSEVLEKEKKWPGRYIPIVDVRGEEISVEGKRYLFSLINQAKDAQRNFNYWRTSATELVALAPKAPFIGPKGSFATDPNWGTVNNQTHSYLEYDPVQGQPPPQRQTFTGVPAGALQEALNASDDMKSILGIYDASLGARSNETSGVAITARQREGDVSTFHIIDNLTRGIRHTGVIIIDLIPHVYNKERIVRVMGEDSTTELVTINQRQQGPDGADQVLNNLTIGKYDVVVSSGPSYTTRRQEAAEQMMQLIQAFPQAASVVGDLFAKFLDWPGAEEIATRLKALLPPQLQGLDKVKELPPEAQAVIVALQNQLQQTQQQMQQLQQDNSELRLKSANKQQEIAAKLEAAALDAITRIQIANANNKQKDKELALEGFKEVLNREMLGLRQQISNSRGPVFHAETLHQAAPPQMPSQKRKVSITAPSGAVYTGEIEDVNDDIPLPPMPDADAMQPQIQG